MMSDKELLLDVLQSKPITYRADFARICDSVTAGVMLSQAYYWTGRSTKHGDGWFEKTGEEWQEETALSFKQQQTARYILEKKGFMESKRLGDRGRMCSRVMVNGVYEALFNLYKADQQNGESEKQISKRENLHKQNGDSKISKKGNLSLQRIHSESTTESEKTFGLTPPTFENTKTSKKVQSDKDKAKLDEIKKIGEPVFDLLTELGFEKMNKSKEMCDLVARAVKECGVDFVLRGVRGRAKSHEGKDPYWRFFFKDTVQISTAAASVKQSSGGGFNKVWQESA